jgi:glycosyltransferase involved in cell wall biosynthesis
MNGARVRTISLLITCCDQKAWLERVLESAVTQRVDRPFEIIVCDDGSTDGVLTSLIRIISGRHVDFRYVWQPNEGFRPARSRNNGMRMATGDLLVFVDGDTILAPSLLADHCQLHQDAGVLGCGLRKNIVVETVGDLEHLPAASLLAQDDPPESEEQQQRRWLDTATPWMACLGGNFSVRRNDCLPFDERFTSWGSEDRDLAFRLCRRGLTPRLLARPNGLHVKRPDAGFSHMKHDAIVALLRNKRLLRSMYPGGEMEPALRLIRFCHLDPGTQRWALGQFRSDVSADDVLQEFTRWSHAVGL